MNPIDSEGASYITLRTCMHFAYVFHVIQFGSFRRCAEVNKKKSFMYTNRLSFIFHACYRNGILYGRVNSVRWSSFTYDYIRNEHLTHVPSHTYTIRYVHCIMYTHVSIGVKSPHIARIVLGVCEARQYINMEIGYFIRRSTHVYASHM